MNKTTKTSELPNWLDEVMPLWRRMTPLQRHNHLESLYRSGLNFKLQNFGIVSSDRIGVVIGTRNHEFKYTHVIIEEK